MKRLALAFLFLAACSVAAQDFISARAGYLNYQEGQRAQARRQIQEGEGFQSGRSRAELLLTPGSFLRLERGAEIRMLSTRLSDPQVELIDGTVGLEVVEFPKGSHLAMVWGDYRDDRAFLVAHKGIYRFQAQNGALRLWVENGSLKLPGSGVTLKKGHWVEFNSAGVAPVAKFNTKAKDAFDLWSSNRAGVLSAASYRSAHSYNPNGFRTSIWAFSSFLGYYTFLPYSGFINSPWGYSFYSPRYVWIYSPGYGPGRGSVMPMPGTGSGQPGGGSPAASAPAPPQMRISVPPPRPPAGERPKAQIQ